MNKLAAVLVSLLTLPSIAFAQHEHDEHGQEEHEHEEAEGDGIKLGEEALKNFGIKSVEFKGGNLTLPKSAIFFGLQEKNLYRLRSGFFKRIDFKTISKTKTDFTVFSSDLKPGDRIVTEGLGFLRIAEIAASGGLAHGHSH